MQQHLIYQSEPILSSSNIRKGYRTGSTSVEGDLHADLPRMVRLLMESGIVNPDNDLFQEILKTYQSIKPIQDPNTVQKNSTALIELLKQLQVIDHNKVLVLIGDTVADRGKNDQFILKLFKILEDKKIRFYITLSNHDFAYFKDQLKVQNYTSTKGLLCHEDFCRSYWATKDKLDPELIDIFRKHVKPFHITLNGQNGLSFISHSPFGLLGLYHIAITNRIINKKITFNELLADKKLLIKTVQAVNDLWADEVQKKEISNIFEAITWLRNEKEHWNFDVSGKSTHGVSDLRLVCRKYMGIRYYGNFDQKYENIVDNSGIVIQYGHTRYLPKASNFICLDSDFGKAQKYINEDADYLPEQIQYPVVCGNLDIKIQVQNLFEQLLTTESLNTELEKHGLTIELLHAFDFTLSDNSLTSPAFDGPLQLNELGLENYNIINDAIIAEQNKIITNLRTARQEAVNQRNVGLTVAAISGFGAIVGGALMIPGILAVTAMTATTTIGLGVIALACIIYSLVQQKKISHVERLENQKTAQQSPALEK